MRAKRQRHAAGRRQWSRHVYLAIHSIGNVGLKSTLMKAVKGRFRSDSTFLGVVNERQRVSEPDGTDAPKDHPSVGIQNAWGPLRTGFAHRLRPKRRVCSVARRSLEQANRLHTRLFGRNSTARNKSDTPLECCVRAKSKKKLAKIEFSLYHSRKNALYLHPGVECICSIDSAALRQHGYE
jgi:hypothetical protein